MNTIAKFLFNPIKHIIGVGYGECNCCGYHWNIVKEHTVMVNDHRGVFAICEDCWKSKSDEEIIAAYNKQYDNWLFGDKYNGPLSVEAIGFTRNELINAVKEALKERKYEGEVHKA